MKTKFCEWSDHQECVNRLEAKENSKNYCECDCHKEEGWIDATLTRWRMSVLKTSKATVVDVWFKDKIGGSEWEWRIGVWSAAKMMGLPIPPQVNPLSMIHPAQVIGHLKKETRYQIKLGGYRSSMRRHADTILKVQYVRVKKQGAIEGK